MAAPTYSEDLTDIDLGQSTTGWSAYGGGGAGLGTGADFAIQSTLAVDKQITNADKGMMHNDGGVSLGASDHIFGWIYAATPGLLDTLANGGKVMAIGTSTGNFNKYALEGSDTRPEGGNKPYAVRYSTSTPSPGSQVGSPGATPTFFGGGLNTTATAKGANLGCDAFRYGTGAYITAGEVADPATIAGFATQDELSANKWGVMFRNDGIYQWQGRFAVGQNNAGTATAAHFDDTEAAAIVVLDTLHSQTDFTQWIIDHASTVFNCSNKTFFVRGTNNPGAVVINNASATSTGWNTCVWNDWGTIEGHVNVPYTNCSFNRCDQVAQSAGTFESCSFDSSTATAAILADDIGLITSTRFISDGTGHAIEIDTTGTYTFTGNTFSGYAGVDGSTGNEAIYNNSGGSVTINVAGGGDTPTIRNGASASTTVVAGAVTVQATATLKDGTPVENALVYLKASDGTGPFPFEDTVTITRSSTTATVSHTAHGLATNDKVIFEGITDKTDDNYKIRQVTVTNANTYTYTTTDSGSTSYTGTILCTFVALSALTNASGIASTSRVYASNQPVTGWTRKSSASPYLQEGVLNGTINSTTGFAGTAVMLDDE